MSEQKVPLPEPVAWMYDYLGRHVTLDDEIASCAAEIVPVTNIHTADQLQSYGDAREQAGWNAAIEWAASQFRGRTDSLDDTMSFRSVVRIIAEGRK